MEEIKVGDYVRINGIIERVEQVGNSLFWLEDGSSYSLSDKTVKHSKNIIDLIGVGDIIEINKEKYEVIYDESLDKLGVLIPNRNYLEIRHSALEHIFEKYENITILTKEQYKQNCYTVERKKEC